MFVYIFKQHLNVFGVNGQLTIFTQSTLLIGNSLNACANMNIIDY